jgi:putative FmdB family regulatory protein
MAKWIMFDFRCADCGEEFEALDKQEPVGEPTPCPRCLSTATSRLISTPHFNTIGMATDSKSSSDALNTTIDRWAKMRRQKMTIEKRSLERHGTYR